MTLKSEINICMITDNNYVIPTAVAMTSAICNKSSDSVYHFYLLINDVSADDLRRLSVLRRKDVKIDFIEVDASKYDKINVKTHVPKSAALKFDIPNTIKTDKVLYIDGDIIVCQDLEELYAIDLEDKIVGGVRDMVGELKQHFNQTVGCEKYFNSGVLLLDLKKMRDQNCSDLLIAAKMEHPQWKCMDQDAFNYVLNSKTKWIGVENNSMLALYQGCDYKIEEINDFYNVRYKSYEQLIKNSKIIHMAGKAAQRPWKVSNGTFGELWDSYYKQSPYKDIVLQRGVYCASKKKERLAAKIKKYTLFGFIPLFTIEEK
ncbi:MAG: glycosyltransferase family 8 protein [Alphaproteobacteria bacterium]|nr:glycosyltransferase family 8 protein [Alphaproteobacteria bacterium]